jgi:hypothetical protein
MKQSLQIPELLHLLRKFKQNTFHNKKHVNASQAKILVKVKLSNLLNDFTTTCMTYVCW